MLQIAIAVYIASVVADVLTTMRAIRIGAREFNPALSTKAGFRRWLRIILAAVVVVIYIVLFAGPALVEALFVAAIVNGAFATWNFFAVHPKRKI